MLDDPRLRLGGSIVEMPDHQVLWLIRRHGLTARRIAGLPFSVGARYKMLCCLPGLGRVVFRAHMVWCCRQVLQARPDPILSDALAVADHYCLGLATKDELQDAYQRIIKGALLRNVLHRPLVLTFLPDQVPLAAQSLILEATGHCNNVIYPNMALLYGDDQDMAARLNGLLALREAQVADLLEKIERFQS